MDYRAAYTANGSSTDRAQTHQTLDFGPSTLIEFVTASIPELLDALK